MKSSTYNDTGSRYVNSSAGQNGRSVPRAMTTFHFIQCARFLKDFRLFVCGMFLRARRMKKRERGEGPLLLIVVDGIRIILHAAIIQMS